MGAARAPAPTRSAAGLTKEIPWDVGADKSSRTSVDHYQEVAKEAGTTGDWNPFADLFTEDATYIEHHYGTMGGREAIRRWICSTMGTYPGSEMVHFPMEWYVIDKDRGWVVCQVWNRMVDPGDGSLHQAYNFTLLKYAGNNRGRRRRTSTTR